MYIYIHIYALTNKQMSPDPNIPSQFNSNDFMNFFTDKIDNIRNTNNILIIVLYIYIYIYKTIIRIYICYCISCYLFFSYVNLFLDPALNVYFDLTIRGTDTVSIDWTLHVPLSFKWVEQKSS